MRDSAWKGYYYDLVCRECPMKQDALGTYISLERWVVWQPWYRRSSWEIHKRRWALKKHLREHYGYTVGQLRKICKANRGRK